NPRPAASYSSASSRHSASMRATGSSSSCARKPGSTGSVAAMSTASTTRRASCARSPSAASSSGFSSGSSYIVLALLGLGADGRALIGGVRGLLSVLGVVGVRAVLVPLGEAGGVERGLTLPQASHLQLAEGVELLEVEDAL